MIIFTDDTDFAENYISSDVPWLQIRPRTVEKCMLEAKNKFIPGAIFFRGEAEDDFWTNIFITRYAENSQYDDLIELSRQDCPLPANLLCCAGFGNKFHGFHNRSWVSLPGNIHLSVYFRPHREIPDFASGFMIIAALSALEAIDEIPGMRRRAMIKWVNDIVIDGAKVCGVLAFSQSQGNVVTDAILGIGMNVESTPKVEPNIFVPRTACLRKFTPRPKGITLASVFPILLERLKINYLELIHGGYESLLKKYINRSIVIGRRITMWADHRDGRYDMLESGRVRAIGRNLELLLEDSDRPVTRGRLQLHD
ncbi:MAG: biotin--[acetyl-CoA-carboxylase] ligase [Candidatus Kapaibacterium sp.]